MKTIRIPLAPRTGAESTATRSLTGALLLSALSLGAVSVAPIAHAQKYPEKPIRIVVPFAPGGGADIFGRLVAQRLSETLGTTVVENRPGAGSTVGMRYVAQAQPDGYTLLLSSAAFSAAPALYPKLGYDPLKDFAPISVVTTVPLVIITHPALPVKTIPDLIKLAKAKPGALLYSTAGPGSLIHLVGESFMAATGTQFTQVAYKGGGQAMAGVMTGETQVMFATIETVMGQIRAGKLRAVGMTTAERSAALPDVPTVREQGVKDYEAQGWFALFAPAGTATDIINRIQTQVAAAMKIPEFRERFTRDGAVPVGGTPAQLDKLVRSEIAMWSKLAKEANIRID